MGKKNYQGKGAGMNRREPVIVLTEKKQVTYPSITDFCKTIGISRTKAMKRIEGGEPLMINGQPAYIDLEI